MTIRIEKEGKKSDEELMRQFSLSRSDEYFSELYQRYFVSLAKYLSWLCGNKDQGQDIAQSIMLKIYQNPLLFDSSRNFKVWLFSISKNQWKNEIRDEAVRKKHLESLRIVEENEPEQIDHKEKLSLLEAALSKLSESHREVFILKYSNNLSIKEISKVCALSEGTVKSRLFYALKNLKDQVHTKDK